MKGGKIDASALLLLAILLLLIVGAGITFHAVRTDPVQDALAGDLVVNTLFVLEKDGVPLGSYVLMYYPATKRAAVFDIPGALGLIIKSVNRVDRIDTLYAPHKIDAYAGEIENLLGIEIPFYVVIKLEAVGQLVDLMEGVDLFIPDAVEVYDEAAPVLLPAGKVRLDGDKAMLFATYAPAEEDPADGVERRQRLFLALLRRLGEQNEHLARPAVAGRYRALMDVNIPPRSRNRLFDEFMNIDADRVAVQAVGGNLKDVSGQQLLFPYYDGSLIKEIVNQALSTLTRRSDASVSERVFTVEVLNGTPTSGLARQTAELLKGFGYDILTVGNADRGDYEQTEIIDRSGNVDMAKNFAEVIRCRTVRSEAREGGDGAAPTFEYKADFTIIIGKDFNGRYVVE
jgi:anionic cell wall polymer biosynthesis LytR-Cps2A-Psr (LCP) family protein